MMTNDKKNSMSDTETKDLGELYKDFQEVVKPLCGTPIKIAIGGGPVISFTAYKEVKTDEDIASVLLDVVNMLMAPTVVDTEIF